MDFKGVIFDLDGTLLDTTQAHILAWIEASKSLGIHEVDEAFIRQQLGKTSLDIAKEILIHYNKPTNLVERLANLKDTLFIEKYLKESKLIPNVKKMLYSLKNKGIKIAIVSSNPSSVIREVLKHMDILKYVDVIIGQDDVKEPKPSPQPILKAISEMNLRKEEVLVVGDSIYDIIAAKRAGVKVYGVLTGVGSLTELRNAGAVRVLRNASMLVDYVSL